MKKNELIKLLENIPDDSEIYVSTLNSIDLTKDYFKVYNVVKCERRNEKFDSRIFCDIEVSK